MKLVKVEVKAQRRGAVAISCDRKGMIRLSVELCKTLKITQGTNIAFFKDQDETNAWYLAPNEPGLKVRKLYKNENKAYGFNCSCVSNQLLDLVKKDSASFLVSTEPVNGNYYFIITKSVK